MSLKLSIIVVIAVLAVARRARAERAIEVDVEGAPFAAAELVSALRIRVGQSGAAVHVRVIAIDGGVRVATTRGSRDVPLADLQGAAAVRLVALAASDLLVDDAAPVPAPVVHSTYSLTVLGSSAAWDGALLGASAELGLAHGRWLGSLEVGGGGAIGGQIQVYDATVRACVGIRLGEIELRAGATAVPITVTTGTGDTTVLVGGGVSARGRVPLSSTAAGVISVGVDAFTTRSHYELSGAEVLVTPWLAPWLALGVEVAL